MRTSSTRSDHRTPSLRAWFWMVLGITFAARLAFAWAVPFTSDEAYFFYWGRYPDYGFYDHPPMVGWLLGLVGALSDAPVVLRLPALLVPVIGAFAVRWLARPAGEERALLAAIGFALVPVEVFYAGITTDAPLIVFSVLSVVAFAAAVRERSLPLHALAGALLGLAFLSKYFAVLLGFAYLVYGIASPRAERRSLGVAVALAAAVPFGFVNLAWNYDHCWANIMFNVFNRHDKAVLAWKTPLVYAAELVYLFGPVALWALLRDRGWMAAVRADAHLRLLAVVVAAPLAVFAVLSPWKTIGLHWLLSFVPAFFALAGLVLDPAVLRTSAKFFAGFSLVHLAVLAIVLAVPIETFERYPRFYSGLVMTAKGDDLLAALAPWEGKYEFAAEGYSPTVTMSYNALRAGFTASPSAPAADPTARSRFFVFGQGSSHARHDDILTDFRKLAGRDIAVIRKTPPPRDDYIPFFSEIEFRTVEVRGATYYLALGQGFDYEAYRDRVLVPIRERFYRIPPFLPQGRCYFCERYFDSPTCPGR